MRKPLPQVRYINPASIEIGDTIKVTRQIGDIKVERTGTVASREYEGGMRVLMTGDGQELFRWHPEHTREIKITLLARETRQLETLPGM